jgi:high-affinity nickel-transport protein
VLTAALLGFVLGLRHASDPDHVIAVSAIVARHRRAFLASWIGVAWGLGHAATVLAAGALLIALDVAVSDSVAASLEGAVGVVLVALGVGNLRTARNGALHAHDEAEAFDAEGGTARAMIRAFGVGLVHGLAGSAAVALLALAAMPTPAAAFAYLAVFGLGTIGGMLAISLGVGAPLAWVGTTPRARRWIVAGSGALSMGFGAWIVWETVSRLRDTLA